MYSILAIDDEKANLVVLNQILSPEYSVYMAKSGSRGLQLVADNRPDLIFLDIIMPEMDGFEVLTKLKESPDTKDVPVIIITGLDNPHDEERGFILGASDYITKPFKPAVIKARVNAQMKRVALAQAEYYNKAKNDFLSRMSHEMRTPLNAIMGMTSIARSSDNDERRMNCLDRIDESSLHLLYLIDNILDMAKIDAGNFELAPYKFSFTKAVEQIIADISIQAGAKKQQFTFKIDPAIPDSLIADGRRLGQVLLHLLSNGVKFTPVGGAISFSALKLTSLPSAPDGDDCAIRFEVKDSGIGISGELKERLGNAFEQMDNSITRIYGGTGLGLAISKRIVQMMDGSIEVDSDPGGSCFICTVKVKADTSSALMKNGSGAAASAIQRPPEQICCP
jgi:signal transduction histidine kinase